MCNESGSTAPSRKKCGRRLLPWNRRSSDRKEFGNAEEGEAQHALGFVVEVNSGGDLGSKARYEMEHDCLMSMVVSVRLRCG